MKTKNHYLASANTGQGFTNYFKYINNPASPSFMYILKGGPGTGKSTMLKKIGEYFYENGESIEYFHCSSDPSSLDGVRLVSRNVAIVDGTAPHTLDATLPSVSEKIINLGDCINDDVTSFREQLCALVQKKKDLYSCAYKYLSIAKESMLLYTSSCQSNLEPAELVLKKIFPKPFNQKGSVRHLFLAFWSKKSKSTLNKLNHFEKTYYIDGNIVSIDTNMRFLTEKFVNLGYDIIMFHNTLLPELVSSIFIPQLNIFVCSKEKNYSLYPDDNVHLSTSSQYTALACKTLSQCKLVHKEIEKYYIQNVDFDELNRITAKIIGNIENKIECTSD